MADENVDSEYLMLFDNWPQDPTPILQAPTGGFTGSTVHNTAAALHRLGEKALVRNHASVAGLDGWCTFIYLQLSNTGGPTPAAKQWVVPTAAASGPYVVTNDPDVCLVSTGCLLTACLISPMTDQRFGWFWCGGVVPEEYVSGMGGDYDTDGNLAVGPFCVHDLATHDELGLGPIATNTEAMIGYTLSADS